MISSFEEDAAREAAPKKFHCSGPVDPGSPHSSEPGGCIQLRGGRRADRIRCLRFGHTGTISGASWTTKGKFGNALSFNGTSDWVTISDANDLDLTTGMTLEAWVYPTALGAGEWRNVLIKERPGDEVYDLYANSDSNAPVVYAVPSATPATPLGRAVPHPCR